MESAASEVTQNLDIYRQAYGWVVRKQLKSHRDLSNSSFDYTASLSNDTTCCTLIRHVVRLPLAVQEGQSVYCVHFVIVSLFLLPQTYGWSVPNRRGLVAITRWLKTIEIHTITRAVRWSSSFPRFVCSTSRDFMLPCSHPTSAWRSVINDGETRNYSVVYPDKWTSQVTLTRPYQVHFLSLGPIRNTRRVGQ